MYVKQINIFTFSMCMTKISISFLVFFSFELGFGFFGLFSFLFFVERKTLFVIFPHFFNIFHFNVYLFYACNNKQLK